MELKRFFSIQILLVFLLFGYVYYATVFVFIDDWVGLQSSIGLLNSLIFSGFAFMFVLSLFSCVLTDPGGVPSGYVSDVEDNPEFGKNGVNPGQCDKCFAKKPPRAHHCRVCRRCVLRMDHHCFWINNCVGYRNYKPFLLLVFYATVASIYSAIIVITSMLQKDLRGLSTVTQDHVKSFQIWFGVVTTGLSVLLGSFLLWNIYLISHNMTTIEHRGGKRAAWLAKKCGQTYRHPYDVGPYKNITTVLGPNVVKWFWPTAVNHLEDGLSFPTAHQT